MPSALTLTLPCAALTLAPLTDSGASPSMSLSLASTSMLKIGVLIVVDATSAVALGLSLTGVTLIGCAAALDVAPSLSVAEYEKLVLPFQFASGTKLSVALPPLAAMTLPTLTATPPNSSAPWAGSEPIVKLAMVPSMSAPDSVTAMPAASSAPDAGVTTALGASLAPLTVTVMSCDVPSAVATLKVSVGWSLLVSACTLASPLRSV